MTENELARVMWDAYSKAAGGKNYLGNPLPDWEGLGEDRQKCWMAAARAAMERCPSF